MLSCSLRLMVMRKMSKMPIPDNLERQQIVQLLSSATDVLLLVHQIPDGDALGSLSAMLTCLQKQGKNAIAYCDDPVPGIYKFLPGMDQLYNAVSIPKFSPSLAVVMDCADQGRVGHGMKLLEGIEPIVNIDHHLGNTLFGHLNWVDSKAAACGEQIYQLILSAGWEITPDVATALYTSLVTDTGSFQFSNATAYTLRLAADLRDKGARVGEITQEVYETKTLTSIRLLSEVLPTLRLSSDGRIAWLKVKKHLMERLNAGHEDCEGLIAYPRSLEGVEVALLFREMDQSTVKVGLRSKGNIDVNFVARQFGGGGHRRASGCTLYTNMDDAEAQVLEAVKSMLMT